MRLAIPFLVASVILAGLQSALAEAPTENAPNPSAPAASMPEGWSRDGDRTVHEASATRCLNEIAGFRTMRLSGPVEPNIVGTCRYEDASGAGDAGMQVRRYMRNVGESPEAIANDRALMEPGEGHGTPMMMVRFAPVTTRNGQMGGVVIITKARNGFLIDCFGEGRSIEDASKKIGLFCAN